MATITALRVLLAIDAALVAAGLGALLTPAASEGEEASWSLVGDSLASVAVELGVFCLAFALVRFASPKGARRARKGAARRGVAACGSPPSKVEVPVQSAPRTLPELRAMAADGRDLGEDLERWAAALAELNKEHFVEEAVAYLRRQDPGVAGTSLATMMDAAARAGLPDAIVALSDAMRELGCADERHFEQCVVAAHAAAGDDAEVEARLRSIAAGGEVPMKTFSVVVRGCLSSGRLQQAARYLSVMNEAGYEVPAPAVTELVSRSWRAFGDLRKVAEWLGDEFPLPLPPSAVVHMIDECFELETAEAQAASAALVEQFAVAVDATLPYAAYGKLLRLYARSNNASGAVCVRRMVKEGHRPCERLCRTVMLRCVESQNVALAEALAAFLRSNSEMGLVDYKTLMKVYACAGMYGKICDLYHLVLTAGLEPDAVMYGSLLKFAAKAGRTALSQELLLRSEGTGCVKTLLWTIRSAGQQGDLPKALDAFESLKRSQPRMADVMGYNMVIDACCSNKHMSEAVRLAAEMKANGVRKNNVTFNTLMKGYCQAGNLDSAKRTMAEMKDDGLSPDTTSFSCLLSCAAKACNTPEMWSILATMDSQGLSPDSYVVSIMMQAARKTQKPDDAFRMLSILDRPDVKICEDEIVFNCVLDACLARKDRRRLDRALRVYASPANRVRPSLRTYSLVIRACAALGRTDDAMAAWSDMLKQGDIRPNDIAVGCIIDALVEGRAVEEALAVFQEWKGRVKYDTVIYASLIKGFSYLGDADRAVALYRDMKAEKVPVNHIVFLSLITAYARAGNMKPADGILEEMEAEGCKPNAITYSVMIRGHCIRGDLAAALEVLQEMVGLGFPADCIIFNTLLDGCVRHANWDLADTLLQEMAQQGVERSNFTVSILVKMWSKRGDLDRAVRTVKEALAAPQALAEHGGKRQRGPIIDAQVGSCIVGACIHNRDPERALEVFRDMKSWPGFEGPDANAYGAMICGMAKHGYLHEAVEIAEEACVALRSAYDRKTIAPSVFMQLFRALRANGSLQEVGPGLSAKLREAGMAVDEHWLKL